mgnify:CR=1 FL=1
MTLIPEEFLAKIRAFLEAKKTGQIQLNIKEGKILQVDIRESFRLRSAQ